MIANFFIVYKVILGLVNRSVGALPPLTFRSAPRCSLPFKKGNRTATLNSNGCFASFRALPVPALAGRQKKEPCSFSSAKGESVSLRQALPGCCASSVLSLDSAPALSGSELFAPLPSSDASFWTMGIDGGFEILIG